MGFSGFQKSAKVQQLLPNSCGVQNLFPKMDLWALDPIPVIAGVQLGRTIGRGAFAVVKEASLARPSSKLPAFFAVKYVHRPACHRKGISDDRMGLELKIHRECSAHPNVIHLFSYGTDNVWVYHVLELAAGGDLFDKIEPDIGIDDMLANFYFVQLVNAVDFLHRKGVAHRDIKPENILLDEDGNLKLADFGLSTVFRKKKDTKVILSTDKCGSGPYMAPEVFGEDSYHPMMADIWACGIVVYVLLTGQIPWDIPVYGKSHDYTNYVDRKDTDPWPSLDPVVRSLLKATMCPDPARRLTIEQIRLHPWFSFDNEFMDPDSLSKDPSQIAEQLYSNLDVDLLKPSSDSQPQTAVLNNYVSLSQPVTAHAAFSTLPGSSVSSQAPLTTAGSRLKHDKILETISKDPSMLQFQAPELRMSQLSRSQQQMARFTKLSTARMTRFFSVVPVESLVAMLRDALHRVGVSTNDIDNSIINDLDQTEAIAIDVTTVADRSKLTLKGLIVVDKCNADANLWKVEFQKTKGDPLDWRRFFKKITIICRDAVYID